MDSVFFEAIAHVAGCLIGVLGFSFAAGKILEMFYFAIKGGKQ